MKPFLTIGTHLINRDEVKEVYLETEQETGVPIAIITYKDGQRIKIRGESVPTLEQWLTNKPESVLCPG